MQRGPRGHDDGNGVFEGGCRATGCCVLQGMLQRQGGRRRVALIRPRVLGRAPPQKVSGPKRQSATTYTCPAPAPALPTSGRVLRAVLFFLSLLCIAFFACMTPALGLLGVIGERCELR